MRVWPAAIIVLASLAFLLAGRDRDGVSRAAASIRVPPALVTVAANGGGQAVPASFLGLSTEYWTLPEWERHAALLERVLALLRVPGDGPLVLRVGGNSSQLSIWDPNGRALAPWAFAVTPQWLHALGAVVRAGDLRVILDLNLLTDSAQDAARFAQAARAILPAHSLVGFEIGNEQDIYTRAYWLAATDGGLGAPAQPASFSADSYAQDYYAYAQALAHVDPGVALLGPAIAEARLDRSWIATLLAWPHPRLSAITTHSYPLNECASPGARVYPTIGRLLSPQASSEMAAALLPSIRLAHGAGLPYRLTEINSVTCGGRRGVSNTFATALWAPDALFNLAHVGVDAVNLHVRADAINAAFELGNRGLTARPLLYGLILFTRTLGPRARLLGVRVQARHGVRLKAWAVRLGDGLLHVLLIDEGLKAADVHLRLPAQGPARVERLLAPSVSSSTGVTLAGQSLGAGGAWHGRLVVSTAVPEPGGYRVTLRPMSAALISVLWHGPGANRAQPAAGRNQSRPPRVRARDASHPGLAGRRPLRLFSHASASSSPSSASSTSRRSTRTAASRAPHQTSSHADGVSATAVSTPASSSITFM